MSDNEKKNNLIDSVVSESGLGSMDPSPNVSEVSQSMPTADLSVQSVTNADITRSIIIDHAEAQSTPVLIKTNIKEKELSLEDIFDFMKTNFSKVNSNFNKQSNDFDEKFDKIDHRFDV